jgi:hypothetical protein
MQSPIDYNYALISRVAQKCINYILISSSQYRITKSWVDLIQESIRCHIISEREIEYGPKEVWKKDALGTLRKSLDLRRKIKRRYFPRNHATGTNNIHDLIE